MKSLSCQKTMNMILSILWMRSCKYQNGSIEEYSDDRISVQCETRGHFK